MAMACMHMEEEEETYFKGTGAGPSPILPQAGDDGQGSDDGPIKSGTGRANGKGKGSALMCKVCKKCNAKKKQLYCEECLKDVAACRKDAEEQGWSGKFEEASRSESAFQDLILQYKLDCPSMGRGKKRAILDHRKFFKTTYHDQQARRGTKDKFMDWGEFCKFFTEEKGFETLEAAAMWKELADTATEFDDLGRKGQERRYPVPVEKYILRENVHGIKSGSELSSKLAKKRKHEDDEEEDVGYAGEEHDFASAHFNAKALKVSSGSRSGASSGARL